MADTRQRSSDIDISKINPAGIGGLGIVIAALGVAWALPSARSFVLIGLAGGIILSVPLYFWRKNHMGRR